MVRGQKFASDIEVQSVFHQWLGQQPELLFALVFHKLDDR